MEQQSNCREEEKKSRQTHSEKMFDEVTVAAKMLNQNKAREERATKPYREKSLLDRIVVTRFTFTRNVNALFRCKLDLSPQTPQKRRRRNTSQSVKATQQNLLQYLNKISI